MSASETQTRSGSSQEEQPPSLLFIHSAVDEFGFTAPQFRVLCAVARAGGCWMRIDRLAKLCRLSPDTTWDALRFLTDHKALFRTARPGDTTMFSVNPAIADWIPTGNGGAPETEGHLSKPGRRHRKARGAGAPETEGHKVYPSKGDPIKGTRFARKSTRFQPPTLEEVKLYEASLKKGTNEAERFLNYWESAGWKRRSGPVVCWKASLRTWLDKLDKERPYGKHASAKAKPEIPTAW